MHFPLASGGLQCFLSDSLATNVISLGIEYILWTILNALFGFPSASSYALNIASPSTYTKDLHHHPRLAHSICGLDKKILPFLQILHVLILAIIVPREVRDTEPRGLAIIPGPMGVSSNQVANDVLSCAGRLDLRVGA
jgi:hypothetical protein